jgi:hypothetical protein
MLDAMDAKRAPSETFYDGYVVNAIIDACYRSMKLGRWEPVELEVWRGKEELQAEAGKAGGGQAKGKPAQMEDGFGLVKKEKMPDGRTKVILREKATGRIIEKIES